MSGWRERDERHLVGGRGIRVVWLEGRVLGMSGWMVGEKMIRDVWLEAGD